MAPAAIASAATQAIAVVPDPVWGSAPPDAATEVDVVDDGCVVVVETGGSVVVGPGGAVVVVTTGGATISVTAVDELLPAFGSSAGRMARVKPNDATWPASSATIAVF